MIQVFLNSNLNIAYTFAFVNSCIPIVLFLPTSDMLRLVRFDGFLDIWLIFASPEKFLNLMKPALLTIY